MTLSKQLLDVKKSAAKNGYEEESYMLSTAPGAVECATKKGNCHIIYLEDIKGARCTPFNLAPDRAIHLEEEDPGQTLYYPGAQGNIWEFPLTLRIFDSDNMQEHQIPVIIVDGEIAEMLAIARIVWGLKARNQYKIAAITAAKILSSNICDLFHDDVHAIFGLENINKTCEYAILRAGAAIVMEPYIPNLQRKDADCKRQPETGPNLFRGSVKGTINWGFEDNVVASEICMASGANMEAFTQDLIRNKYEQGLGGKRFFLNSVFITMEGLRRFLPLLLEKNIKPIVMCVGGIFNLYKHDLHLPNGELVHGGTLIAPYRDLDPNNRPIMTRAMFQYILDAYGGVGLSPDLNGEVGEKIQDNLDIEVINYDLNELFALGVPLDREPWASRIHNAFRLCPGAFVKLQSTAPALYGHLLALGLIEQIVPQPSLSNTTSVEVIIPLK